MVPEAIDAEVARLKLAAMGHHARRDDARAARVRLLLAARDVEPRMNAEGGHHRHDDRPVVVAPYGSWRSPIDIELVVGIGDRAQRAVARRRRRLLARVALGAGRAADPHAPHARRRDARAHAVPVQGRQPRPRVRRRRRTSSTGAGSSSRRRTTAGCGGSRRRRAAEPVALTPPDGGRFADLRFDPLRERLYAVRETHDAKEPDRPDLVVNELVDDRARRLGRRRAACSWPGPTSTPRRGRRPMAGRSPGSNGTTRTCPGTRSACGRPMSPTDGALGPARTIAGGPDVSIVQPAWRADGVLHFVSDAPSGWWNLFALDGDRRPRRPGAEPGADGGGARRPRVGLRPVVVRVHRRRRDPGRGPRRRPRRAACGSRRTVPSNPWTRRSARSRGSRSRAGRRC